MRLVIDTNILLYSVNSDCKEHKKSREFLRSHLESGVPWSLTWGIFYEFLRVSTHPKVFPTPLTHNEAFDFLKSLSENSSLTLLSPSDRHLEILNLTLQEMSYSAGNIFYDIRIAVTMREYGISEIVTADTDFLQFKFLKVINPLII